MSRKRSTASAARRAVMDVSGSPHRGVLTGDDMAKWQAHVEAPLTYHYRQLRGLQKPGVWSQGPVMLQQLALLKGFDLDGLDPAGPDFIHLQIECAKLAFADRDTFYGDPDFVPRADRCAAVRQLQRARGASSSRDKASLDYRPGSVEGFGAVVELKRDDGRAQRRRRDGRRRADRRPARQRARRHRAFRHHRSGRQHDLGDAVGRLAAILAGHSRDRLLPRQPRADVLPAGGPPGGAGARAAGRARR